MTRARDRGPPVVATSRSGATAMDPTGSRTGRTSPPAVTSPRWRRQTCSAATSGPCRHRAGSPAEPRGRVVPGPRGAWRRRDRAGAVLKRARSPRDRLRAGRLARGPPRRRSPSAGRRPHRRAADRPLRRPGSVPAGRPAPHPITRPSRRWSRECARFGGSGRTPPPEMGGDGRRWAGTARRPGRHAEAAPLGAERLRVSRTGRRAGGVTPGCPLGEETFRPQPTSTDHERSHQRSTRWPQP